MKWIALFCLLFYPLFAMESSPLSDGRGPSAPLLEMLALHDISHDGSWEDIVEKSQRQLRPKEKEIWDLEPNSQDPVEIYSLATKLEMTQSLHPSLDHYDYGVILGGSTPAMRKRLDFLLEQEVLFDQLVVLVGNRPLQPWEGPEEDETAAMCALLSERDIDVPLLIIDCKIEGRRPVTADTYRAWAPKEGRALIVSSQPFIHRQGAIARNNLQIPFEMVGPGFSMEELQREPRGTAIIWETLIRWIYEECHGNQSQNMRYHHQR